MRHPTALLSDTLGVPEPTLRLLTTILLAYPVAAGFRYLYAQPSQTALQEDTKEGFTRTVNARNRYIAISGLALATYFSGWNMYHGLVTLIVSYGLCLAFQKKREMAVATVWIFNTAYLLTGYYTMASNDYDISWTMPQCIICLRLMGFSMDFMDGKVDPADAAAATPAPSAIVATSTTTTSTTTTTATTVMEGTPTATQTPTHPVDDNRTKNRVSVTSSTETTVATSADSSSSSSSSTRPLSFGSNTALIDLPSFSHMVAYCFYPSAFLIGPQFSFSLYQEWLFFYDTQGSASKKSKQQYKYAQTCLCWAVGYLILQQLVGAHYPTSYLLTSDYASLSPLHRFGIFWLAGKFVFTKYLGVWLLTEGATTLFGIGYEGQTPTADHSFEGLANVNPIKYETATSLEHIIGSFNINTNMWSKYYVFKRLRWMGSKTASQIGTLAFLAIWHGFHYGYFTTFLLEFLDVTAEGILRKWVIYAETRMGNKDATRGVFSWRIRHALAWFLCTSTLFYAGVGFDLLSISSSWVAYRQVYYFGHVGLVVLFASSFFFPRSSVTKVQRKDRKTD
ncbi:MBOAT, membrane-bound O-acyltransferase family-domain-containing protein [Absidia repens]|uniref:Lysophospholipid acyltransferase 5 n=1 Tax=Absidia repens TaxID=90262 RepID=A0A1X2IEK4_9FUNG|nr:MBOAT, membrane-bound O-acyltransferase family-domain-containing protein [Absidia repens]